MLKTGYPEDSFKMLPKSCWWLIRDGGNWISEEVINIMILSSKSQNCRQHTVTNITVGSSLWPYQDTNSSCLCVPDDDPGIWNCHTDHIQFLNVSNHLHFYVYARSSSNHRLLYLATVLKCQDQGILIKLFSKSRSWFMTCYSNLKLAQIICPISFRFFDTNLRMKIKGFAYCSIRVQWSAYSIGA